MRTTSLTDESRLREIDSIALQLKFAVSQFQWRVGGALRPGLLNSPMTSEQLELARNRFRDLSKKLDARLEELLDDVLGDQPGAKSA